MRKLGEIKGPGLEIKGGNWGDEGDFFSTFIPAYALSSQHEISAY